MDIGYYPNGSLSLARTQERLTELRYALTMARHHDLPARELTPDEIAAVSPLLTVDGLAGGVLFEEDATVNPGWAAPTRRPRPPTTSACAWSRACA